MRLDKLLSEMGYGSRSQVKTLIKSGGIMVNGLSVSRPETKVNPETDVISDGEKRIEYSKYEYYMFHKPAGCVTATEDGSCQTVMDFMTGIGRSGFFPVGRLDKDTEGLLLITNDGELAHRLLSPKKHIPKTYYAMVQGIMTSEMIPVFEQGIDIGDDTKTLPAKLEIIGTQADAQSEILLTITEGRYHQVKRMVNAVGCEVIYLKRLSMGSLYLDRNLAKGDYRKLTDKEKALLGIS